MDRSEDLKRAFDAFGLDRVLQFKKVEHVVYRNQEFTKLHVDNTNRWGIRSLEVWERKEMDEYFKVPHFERISESSQVVIDSVGDTPGIRMHRTRTYRTFEGDWQVAMRALAVALAKDLGLAE